MILRSSCLIVAAMLAGAPSLQGQAQYIEIPGGGTCNDITPDGTRVVGTLSNGDAYYWDWQTAPAPVSIGTAFAVAVSDDGTVIAGNIDDPAISRTVAATWTQATGWVSCGYLPGQPNPYPTCGGSASSAYDISGDGTMVVGLSWEPTCSARAFAWTQATGMVPLFDVSGTYPVGARASRIANDKSLAVGFTQGTFNRSPVKWDPVANTGTALGLGEQGEYHGVNNDGSILCGTLYQGAADGWFDAFYMTDGVTPINLGSLNPTGWAGAAADMSDDGARISGYDYQGLSTQAWMSFQGGQPIGMTALLTGLGVGGVPALGSCKSMSSDGTVIVGNTSFGAPWLAVVPSILPASVTGLPGCGQANPNSLVSDGTPPAPGATVTLLQDLGPTAVQPAGSTALLLISTQPDGSYPCGTPVAQTGLVMGPMQLVVNLAFTSFVAYPLLWNFPGDVKAWPLTIPPVPAAIGFKLYFQGAFTPPSFPGKSTLTEGLEMTIGLP